MAKQSEAVSGPSGGQGAALRVRFVAGTPGLSYHNVMWSPAVNALAALERECAAASREGSSE